MLGERRLSWLFRRNSLQNGKVAPNSVSGEVKQASPMKCLLFPTIGMVVFYVGHDALQERMFRFHGFEFGWFMTLAEVFIMLIGGLLTEKISLHRPGGTRTGVTIAFVGLCVASSHGFGNTALRFSSYPLKVAFKSCKLVPTMALGLCTTGRRHSKGEYFAALVMCTGLFMLTVADANHLPSDLTVQELERAYFGPFLLTLSTSLDAVVPNLQERLLQQDNMRTADVIFYSNFLMFLLLVCYTTCSGELHEAMAFCMARPEVFKTLSLQAAFAYLGLRCYLTIIRQHGGVAVVLLANARKIITIVLSFVLFAKPCRPMHAAGMFTIFLGVYFGITWKQKRSFQATRRKSAAAAVEMKQDSSV